MGFLPEDMEERRLAELEKFALNHPDHPMVPVLMKQVQKTEELEESEVEIGGESNEGSWYHWLREKQLQTATKGKRQGRGRAGGKKGSNKWDTGSSLELLTALKELQDRLGELGIKGIRVTSDSRWATIAQSLPNRCGIEPDKYARSCRVHFLNLCRAYRLLRTNSKGKDAMDPQVRRALEEYFQLGDVNVPRHRPRKGSQVKTGVPHMNATKAIISKGSPLGEKIHTQEKRSTMAKAAKIAMEKDSKRRADKLGDPRGNDYNKEVDGTRIGNHGGEGNEDPHDQDELDNPAIDGGGILKSWDKVSALQLLAAVRKVGPKVANRWEAIASQLPNQSKLDRQEYISSCKEQYRALLQIYTRENMQLDLGHKPLVDEVHAQLEKWILLNSTTSKANNNIKRKEIPCGERRDAALEREAVNPAFNRSITKQNDEEGKGVDTKGKRGSAEENHGAGFMKLTSGGRNSYDLDRHTTGFNKGNSWNDPVRIDSDAETYSEKKWQEYRKRVKRKSSQWEVEQQSQTVTNTRNTEFADAEDRRRIGRLQQGDQQLKGNYNKYIDIMVSTSNRLQGRNTSNAATPSCSDVHPAVNIVKTRTRDYHVHGGFNNRSREVKMRRGEEILQTTPRDFGEEGQKSKVQNVKTGTSKKILCDEKMTIKEKLKKQRQADANEKGWSKPFTHRILPDHPKNNEIKSSRDRLLEHGGFEGGETSKGLKRRTRDGDMMTSHKIDDKEVSMMCGTARKIIDSRADAYLKSKAPLLYDSDSNQVQVAESKNVVS
ncbi:unnamed protein product [Calypogeia fissa]